MICSAICATHDRRRFIGEAIACFRDQSLTDSELVIVDDGTDAIADLVPAGDRFRYLRFEGKHHFCWLRDEAAKVARGSFLAVFDDDDLSHPDRLAVQVAELERTGAALCLLGSSVVRSEDPKGEWLYTPPEPWPLDNSAVFVREPGFKFHLDDTCYSALRALKAAFEGSHVVVRGWPELLVTRRHGSNTCARPVGQGPEWRAR